MKIILSLLFITFSLQVNAYLINQGTYGDPTIWSVFDRNLKLYMHPSNSQGVSSADFTSYISSAASQINSNSSINISLFNGSGTTKENFNDAYFSSNALFFGGGSVLAVTQVAYNPLTGAIVEADIMINDSVLISNTPGNSGYVGDLVTHEMGHFVGLDHSQVKESSMLYVNYNGQHSFHSDDYSGLHSAYPLANSYGSVSGKIVGGPSRSAVFGAHVQAISAETGRVIAATFSNQSGAFTISKLPTGVTYYLYVEPADSISNLTNVFREVRNSFCPGGGSFKGSFFSTCNSSDEGYPQGLKVNSGDKYVGEVTIKCGIEVPPAYMAAKGGGTFTPKSVDDLGTGGTAFVGFFSPNEVTAQDEDTIELDLTGYSFTGTTTYVGFKIMGQGLYSEVKYDVDVTGPFGTGTYKPYNDIDNNPVLELSGYERLDGTDNSQNIVTIKVTPQLLTSYLPSHVPATFSTGDFFPALADYGAKSDFYFLMVQILNKNVDGSYSVISERNYEPVSDNSSCTEAVNTFSVKASVVYDENNTIFGSAKKADEVNALACGSIDIDQNSDPGSGPMAIILGFFLVALLNSLIGKNSQKFQ